jgi:hypothetical protein
VAAALGPRGGERARGHRAALRSARLGRHPRRRGERALRRQASASGELFIGKRLGLFVEVFGGRGAFYDASDTIYSRLGGAVGASYWFSRGIGLLVSYAPVWTFTDQSQPGSPPITLRIDEVAHNLTLTVRSRLP